MIVCHRQGGASGGRDRKEATTGRCVGTYQEEMITLVRRKHKRGEGRRGEINTHHLKFDYSC